MIMSYFWLVGALAAGQAFADAVGPEALLVRGWRELRREIVERAIRHAVQSGEGKRGEWRQHIS